MRIRRNDCGADPGAVSIKAIVLLTVVAIAIFCVIKILPVYVEQQQVIHETDELARKAAIGSSIYSADKIQREMAAIIKNYSLPEGSINLVSREDGKSQISVKYSVPIDFLVTTYNWDVDYVSFGKGL